MKILKWWKTVPLKGAPGVSVTIVPEQTAKENEAFFSHILEAVKESDFSYLLYEQTDAMIERR